MGGDSIRLEDLDRQTAKDWLWKTYPKAGTRNRYNNTLSAVVNCWNREKKGQSIFNPFSGLSNKKREKDEREERRSFKPEELSEYLNNIINISDEEVKLIGLLMIYTGCRTSEAAGLQVRDLRIDSNMPHVVYRTNSIRRMEKSDLERHNKVKTLPHKPLENSHGHTSPPPRSPLERGVFQKFQSFSYISMHLGEKLKSPAPKSAIAKAEADELEDDVLR